MESNLLSLYFLIFMMGASFASFICVYLERQNSKKSALWSRSECTKCLRKLNFFELIPVFSYVFLRGKCRTCKSRIPIKLFLAEIFLGVWFLFCYFTFLQTQNEIIYFVLALVFGCLLFYLSLEDQENMMVSSNVLLYLLGVSILGALYKLVTGQNYFTELFIIPLFVVLPFWLIYLFGKIIKRELLGEADLYVFSSIAFFFGMQFTFSLVLYSVWLGAFYGVCFAILKQKKLFQKNNQEYGIRIPFLPVIFFAALFILVSDYHIIEIQDILLMYEYF